MHPRPDFRYAPSIQQLVTVNSIVRFGRKIVANGNTFTPDEAVEFRELMNRAIRDFELPEPAMLASRSGEG